MRLQLQLLFYLLLLHLLLSLPEAGSAYFSSRCGPWVSEECGAGDKKFHYGSGRVYTYSYSVNGTTTLAGGPLSQSGLHFGAKVSLRFLSACDAILFIRETRVLGSHHQGDQEDFTEPNRGPEFLTAVEKYPLRFSFNDGLISFLCPHEEEASWVLNMKRGLLSALQNTMHRLDLGQEGKETDAHGTCQTSYLPRETGSSLSLKKTKDLAKCWQRGDTLHSNFKGVPYRLRDGLHPRTLPFLSSVSECEQVVERNLLFAARCSERHQLRAPTQGVPAPYTSIMQNLQLISVYEESEKSRGMNGTDENRGDFLSTPWNEDEQEADEGEEDEGKREKASGHEEEEGEEDTAPWTWVREPDEELRKMLETPPPASLNPVALDMKIDGGEETSPPAGELSVAREKLKEFCAREVDGGFPLYESLLESLRSLHPPDMMSLSREAEGICLGDRSGFDEVLGSVGTPGSVAVMRERILRGDSKDRIKSWINSLTFIANPDLSLLTEAVSLLKVRDNYPSILLSYSGLAGRFCQQKGPGCESATPVSILSRLYQRYFEATGCVTKRRREIDQALFYLKGLGNFGLISNSTLLPISTCIKKNDRAEVKVAAIQALRRMPCQDLGELGNMIGGIFSNGTEDTEIRINAFLQLIRCPTYSTIKWIKGLINQEKVNQVRSFVTSHIKGVERSSLPSRGELQGLLRDLDLPEPRVQDPFSLRYSRSHHLSHFSRENNLGFGMDGNVIYSTASYLPRSLGLNLTLDLFGESLNLLEGTLRVENGEQVLESIFLGATTGRGKSGGGRGGRERRALSKRKLKNFALDFGAMKEYHSDPVGSLSLRVLGQEVFYQRWVGVPDLTASLASLTPLLWSNESVNYWKRSNLFLDSRYVIPTGAGLPLNLSAMAAFLAIYEGNEGKFMPRGMIGTSVGVTLSGGPVHSGLKVRATLGAALELQGALRPGVDFHLQIPNPNLTLLHYKSELLFIRPTDQAYYEVKGEGEEEEERKGCWPGPLCWTQGPGSFRLAFQGGKKGLRVFQNETRLDLVVNEGEGDEGLGVWWAKGEDDERSLRLSLSKWGRMKGIWAPNLASFEMEGAAGEWSGAASVGKDGKAKLLLTRGKDQLLSADGEVGKGEGKGSLDLAGRKVAQLEGSWSKMGGEGKLIAKLEGKGDQDNLEFGWKLQDEEREGDVEVGREKEMMLEVKRGSFGWFKTRSRVERGLEGGSGEVLFEVNVPSWELDWRLTGECERLGKSFNTSIDLHYAKDKDFSSRLSVQRPPGVLDFLQVGLNMSLSGTQPLNVEVKVEETSWRDYKGEVVVDRGLGSRKLVLDLGFRDKRSRNRWDIFLLFGIRSRLQLGFSLILEPEKERKIRLSAEVGGFGEYGVEGRQVWGDGGKEAGSLRVTIEGQVYQVKGRLDRSGDGTEIRIETEFGPRFDDMELRLGWERIKRGGHKGGLEFRSGDETLFLLRGDWAGGKGNFVGRAFDFSGDYLHVNGTVGPEVLELWFGTPFEKVGSGRGKLDFSGARQLRFDSSWREGKERLGALLEWRGDIPFKFQLNLNISSTIGELGAVNLKLNHVLNQLSSKMDADLQLPNEREISLGWETRLEGILNSMATLQLKTPFPGWQNMDLRALVGRSGGEALALASFHMENIHYALSLTGTPQFYPDGTLALDLTTSNPKYDKIFGSLSYTLVKEMGRFAVQAGLPGGQVHGVELGWEVESWTDFKGSLTSRLVEAMIKFASDSGLELRVEGRETEFLLQGKGDWMYRSWTEMDFRLDGSTHWEGWRKFGIVIAQSWGLAEEEEEKQETEDKGPDPEEEGEPDQVSAYLSQIHGYLEEAQMGYKLEGGQSYLEEEEGTANVLTSELTLDPYFYPGVRGGYSLTVRENRFHLLGSLALPEGPVNLEAHLHLLDVLRFNENITLSTPFPSLLGLQVNLSPAILLHDKVYNLALSTKWRSAGDEWEDAGFFLRLGDQGELAKILQMEAADEAFLEGTEGEVEISVETSQLLHFYSPWRWGKVIRLEYEGAKEGEEGVLLPVGGVKKLAGSADLGGVRAEGSFENGEWRVSLGCLVSVEKSHPSPVLSYAGALDLSGPEKKLSLREGQNFLEGSWISELPASWEGSLTLNEGKGGLTYALDEVEGTRTLDLLLGEVKVNLVLNQDSFTCLYNEGEAELRGELKRDEDDETKVNTFLLLTMGEEGVELDVDSELDEEGWPVTLQGKLSNTLFLQGSDFNQGEVRGRTVVVGNGRRNGTGEILFPKGKAVVTTFSLLLLDRKFREVRAQMETPFEGYKVWRIEAYLKPKGSELEFSFDCKTPLKDWTYIRGQAEIELESNSAEDKLLKLPVQKGQLQLSSPLASANGSILLGLSAWENLNLGLETRLVHRLQGLIPLPPDSGIKVRLRNGEKERKVLLENVAPFFRFGAGLSTEGLITSMKTSSKVGKSFVITELQARTGPGPGTKLNATVNLGLDLDGILKGGRGQVEIQETESKGYIGRGHFTSEAGKPLLRSNLNVTGEKAFFVSVTGKSRSGSPWLELDGSFNPVSAQHWIRSEVGDGWMGLEGNWKGSSAQDFEMRLKVNHTSLEEDGMQVHWRNERSAGYETPWTGLLGGNLGGKEAIFAYNLLYESRSRFNLSLNSSLPFDTESVEAPQNISLLTSLWVEEDAGRREGLFSGGYQGVELVRSRYVSEVSEVEGPEERVELWVENHFFPFKFSWMEGREVVACSVLGVREGLGAEVEIKTNLSGREITLKGTHPNRSLTLIADYELQSNLFRQRSKVIWDPETFLAYEVEVERSGKCAFSRNITLSLTSPRRSLRASSVPREGGWLFLLNDLSSHLQWGGLGGGRTGTKFLELLLNHPKLPPQGVRARTELERGQDVINSRLQIGFVGEDPYNLTVVIQGLEEGWTSFPYAWNFSGQADLDLKDGLGLDWKVATSHSSHELSIITLIDLKGRELRMGLELFKELWEARIQAKDPLDYLDITGGLRGHGPYLKGESKETWWKGQLDIWGKKPWVDFQAGRGREPPETLWTLKGGLEDMRNFRVELDEKSNATNEVGRPLGVFYMRLNNSRLLTSALRWEAGLIPKEGFWVGVVQEGVRRKAEDVRLLVTEWALHTWESVWVAEAGPKLTPFLEEMALEWDFRNDSAALATFFESVYERNELYVRDILGYGQLLLEEIAARLTSGWESVTDLDFFLSGWSELREKIKESYTQLVAVTAWEAWIKEKLYLVLYYGAGAVIKTGELIYERVSLLGAQLGREISHHLEKYQQEILAKLHLIEERIYALCYKISEYLRESKEALLGSAAWVRLSSDVDALYSEFSGLEGSAAVRKVYGMIKTLLSRWLEKMDELVPLGRIGTKLGESWRELRELSNRIWESVSEGLQEAVVALWDWAPAVWKWTRPLSYLEGEEEGVEHKTRFSTHPGLIELEQRLPMPWAAFNERPEFWRLPELEAVRRWVEKSREKGYSYQQLSQGWTGHAVLFGQDEVISWDGLRTRIEGCGNFLLVADLVNGNFSAGLQRKGNSSSSLRLWVTSGHNTLVLEKGPGGSFTLIDAKRKERSLTLPVQLASLEAWMEGDAVVVETTGNIKGLHLSCNLVHEFCHFKVSGWFSHKVGGLLGTMDGEWSTDWRMSSGRISTQGVDPFLSSWAYRDDKEDAGEVVKGCGGEIPDPASSAPSPSSSSFGCDSAFKSLSPCEPLVMRDSFLKGCQSGGWGTPCSWAAAYLQVCKEKGVSLPTPSACVRCSLVGEEMIMGEVRDLNSTHPPADVVYLVEFAECNRAFRARRKIDQLSQEIQGALRLEGVPEVRFAAVSFGGPGVYREPHPILPVSLHGSEFSSAEGIGKLLAGLPTGGNNGSGGGDCLGAVAWAEKHLNFRPGGSKTFILFSCGDCDSRVDYTDLFYSLVERGISLHLFLDQDFLLKHNKELKTAKKVLGFDAANVFKKEGERPELRRGVRLGKGVGGAPALLALRTNGSVFTTRRLGTKAGGAKTFATRLARTVEPVGGESRCSSCLCSGPEWNWSGRLECFQCGLPRFLGKENREEGGSEDEAEILFASSESQEELENEDNED